ncbi:TIGR02594 family protein [Parasedimentitalea marina]|uniref:N-acetylmuramoyl-L-alanine amidase n=1 Tax=Parasedimentitalea marina TaxID=2483033 RepID=A0A3T0N377_9RHOB|nr:TIGR02594 family protein [Parasedimentitalea marina]AZV78444.1 TIGR02594 family protein [Parasedimentitalea marina]
MHKIIDTPWRVTSNLDELRARGVETIIRYFNRANSNQLPEKRLEPAEAAAIADAGMTLAVVYQQRGGSGGNINDLNAKSGNADATRAVKQATQIGQPIGSAIYFAVDWDYFRPTDLKSISEYFAEVRRVLGADYRVGVYGSGLVGKTLKSAGLVDFIWLSMSVGWSGTKALLATDAWTLRQTYPEQTAVLRHDGNELSPAWGDFGQFTPGGAAASAPVDWRDDAGSFQFALMEVTARSGLNLRRGPGTNYGVDSTLAQGQIVQVVSTSGDWANVDVNSDGLSDGYLHSGYLKPVSGGLPLLSSANGNTAGNWPTWPKWPTWPSAPGSTATAAAPATAAGATVPYSVAQAELALDVREVAGPGNNPRVVMYHKSTNPWSGTDDSVAWCSSFVNYCVEQSGMVGTDSQRALSWEDWGQSAENDPQEGDIVVFERVGKGGHVGFLVADRGDSVSVLGGNQNNRVRISTYPKNGKLGATKYVLRSIRRAI